MITIEMGRVQSIAERAARHFRRKVWWAPWDDMVQEGLMAIHQASHTFDPETGCAWDGYAYRAAYVAIRAYLWRTSHPVCANREDRPQLKSCKFHILSSDGEQLRGRPLGASSWWVVESTDAHPVDELCQASRENRIMRRLFELADGVKNGRAALRHLMNEQNARGGTPKEVYTAAYRLKRKIENDYELYKLWDNREDE